MEEKQALNIENGLSFGEEVKGELALLPLKKTCCQKAFFLGLLFGADEEGTAIRLDVPCAACAEIASYVVQTVSGHEVNKREMARGNRRFTRLRFDSSKTAGEIRKYFHDASSDRSFLQKCPNCLPAFLRGAFLSSGSVTDPQKSGHLEFRARTEGHVKALTEILSGAGCEINCVTRKDAYGLYLKRGDAIEDFLTYLGANKAVFTVINTRIEKDIRNNENRATNCVANNIMKSVSSATKTFEAIEKIIDRGLFETMPDELRVTADLRYRNIEMSLSDLAALHDPPISKSGLNHRLMRIREFADQLK